MADCCVGWASAVGPNSGEFGDMADGRQGPSILPRMVVGDEPFVCGDEPWRVWVRSRAMPLQVLGAGVLLGREHVLTCAHVATADAHLAVDMVRLDGMPSSDARIADGLCVPSFAGGHRGDVALLKLSVPQPDGIGATLRRM